MVLPSECPGSRYLIICSVVRSALRTQSESVCTRHAIPQKQEPGMPRDARHMQCTAQGRVLGSTIFVDGQLTVLTQTKKKKKKNVARSWKHSQHPTTDTQNTHTAVHHTGQSTHRRGLQSRSPRSARQVSPVAWRPGRGSSQWRAGEWATAGEFRLTTYIVGSFQSSLVSTS